MMIIIDDGDWLGHGHGYEWRSSDAASANRVLGCIIVYYSIVYHIMLYYIIYYHYTYVYIYIYIYTSQKVAKGTEA